LGRALIYPIAVPAAHSCSASSWCRRHASAASGRRRRGPL